MVTVSQYLQCKVVRAGIVTLAAALVVPAAMSLWSALTGAVVPAGAAVTVTALAAGAGLTTLLLGAAGLRRVARRQDADLARFRKMSLIAEHTRKKVVIADAQGRIEWVNRGFEALSGYTLDEVRGRSPGALFGGPGKDARVTETLRDAVHKGRDVEAEVLNHGRHGSYWVRLELRALHDEQGALTGFIGIETDITRRKQLEMSLQAANERFERVARQSGVVVWELDDEGIVTYASASMEDVLGHPVSQVVGRSFFELLPRDEGAAALQQLRSLIGEGSGLASREMRMVNRDGEARYCITSALPVYDGAGQVTGYRGLFKDITERKLAELRLQESEARFKRAMRGSSDGLWDLDLATGQVYVSDRFKALLGYGPEDMPTHADVATEQALIHPDDYEEVMAARQRHLDDDEPFDMTVRMCCADGSVRWFRIRAAAERMADGRARYLTGVLSDINDLKEAQAQLQWRALHDPLTGLANRQMFLNRLNRILDAPRRRHEKTFAVLSLDFDRFKMVNDLHGHDIGDELLCSIGERLVSAVREEDLVARFGGDEFLILLADVGAAENVEQMAVRLVSACAEPHRLSRNLVLTCTASIGVIVLHPDDDRSADIILREADAAMYQAKAESRGGYRFFDRELQARLANKASLESDLRDADYDREFELLYQPIVDLGTGAVVSLEALLRWRRHGSVVSPADFIPIAEDNGLIVPIGRWVLARACADLADWRRRHPCAASVPVSINVSRRELKDPDYQRAVLALVADHALTPGDITLEITETALVDRQAELLPVARSLQDAGFELAMDDFGTGQSSLNSLVDLPISVLKIDKAFIRDMCDDLTRIAIVNAVVVLARHLELKVVVEGIESAVELAVLQAMDCQFGQGYLFARPMPSDQALALVGDAAAITASTAGLEEVQRHAAS